MFQAISFYPPVFLFAFADAFAATNIIVISFQSFLFFRAFRKFGSNSFQIDGRSLIASKNLSTSKGIISKIEKTMIRIVDIDVLVIQNTESIIRSQLAF